MNPLVKLIGVSKRYADAPALQPTNLTVERGKTTILIGPSGCGKSTLLRLISGLVEPDTGTIEFDGIPITNRFDRLRQRIGYVIQEGGLFPHLTARGNILLMARHLGKSETDLRERLRMGEAELMDVRSRDGGWNYGSPAALGIDLPSYPETTALALVALQGRGDLGRAFDLAGRQLQQTPSPLPELGARLSPTSVRMIPWSTPAGPAARHRRLPKSP